MLRGKGFPHIFYTLESINNEDDNNMRLLRLYRFYGDPIFSTQLIKNNEPLVKAKAKQHYLLGKFDDEATLQDFIQEGRIGLLTAIDKYDINKAQKLGHKNAKFSSYAVFWIRKRIFEFIQNNSMTVRYTGRVQRAYQKYKKLLQNPDYAYGGIEVPLDSLINETDNTKRGIIALHTPNQYEIIENIDIEDVEYNEETENYLQKLQECPLLDDAERKFAVAILSSKEKPKLTYKEKVFLNTICDKMISYRVNNK